jgi:transcription elongation factor Elf1
MLSRTPKTNGSRRRRVIPTRERGGATFICPKCKSLSRVMRTARPDYRTVLRQRRCMKCELIFNTKELQDAERK